MIFLTSILFSTPIFVVCAFGMYDKYIEVLVQGKGVYASKNADFVGYPLFMDDPNTLINANTLLV